MLAAELVRRPVAVIVAIGGSTPAFAAKAETSTIPIVFTVAQDPVKLGLVASLARPGGNMTGIFLPPEATVRRLGFLRELVPTAKRIAVLLDPANATNVARDLEGGGSGGAAPAGCRSRFSTPAPAARSMRPSQASGASAPTRFCVGPFSTDRRVQLALLAVLHRSRRPIPGATLSTPAG